MLGRELRRVRGRQGLAAAQARGDHGGSLHGRAADAPARPAGRGPRQAERRTTIRRRAGDRPVDLVDRAVHGAGARTGCGWPTSPTSRPGPAGSTSPSSSTSSRRFIVGWQASPARCGPTWRSTPWRWRSGPRTRATSTGWSTTPTAGVQYLAIRYTERLAEAGAVPSVGSRGDSYDNALAESINGLYKTELIRTPRPLARPRRRRARHPGVGRLVQPPPPARSHRQHPAGRVRGHLPRSTTRATLPDSKPSLRKPGAVHSVGESSGLIIRRSQVQVLPAPRDKPQVSGLFGGVGFGPGRHVSRGGPALYARRYSAWGVRDGWTAFLIDRTASNLAGGGCWT